MRMLTEHMIQARAYEIWEREGRQDGRELEHWLAAQAELARASDAATGATARDAAAPPKAKRRRAAKAATNAGAPVAAAPTARPATTKTRRTNRRKPAQETNAPAI